MTPDLRSLSTSVNRFGQHLSLHWYLSVAVILVLSTRVQGQPIGQAQSQARGLLDVTTSQFIWPDKPTQGAQAWGDWDNDSRIDLIITGKTPEGPYARESKLYRNTGTRFEDNSVLLPNLPSVSNGAVAWGDYDRDGKLDLILFGETSTGFVSKLYHNTGWGFEDQTSHIPGLVGYAYGDVAWADFDNDGWLDLIVSGKRSDGAPGTQIFRNTGNGSLIYTTLISNLIQVVNSKIACTDFNRDGRPDLLITGEPSTSGVRLIRLYASSIDGYIGASASIPDLPGVNQATLATGDYDGDGWTDLLVTGLTQQSGPVSKLYHNQLQGWNTFEEVSTSLPGIKQSRVVWGDYDRDGRPDLAMVGKTGDDQAFSRLYRNTSDYGFVDVSGQLPNLVPAWDGMVAWGDYDHDGWLDLVMTGKTSDDISDLKNIAFKLYRNKLGTSGGWEDVSSIVPNIGFYNQGTPPSIAGTANWVSFDPNGYPDLHLSGKGMGGNILGIKILTENNLQYLYRNGSYEAIIQEGGLEMLINSSADWADFNKDGLPDLLMAGQRASTNWPVTRLYQSSANVTKLYPRPLTYANGLMPTDMPGLTYASVAWGDYDNDGWPDIIITGLDANNNPQTRLYHNLAGQRFEDATSRLPNAPGVANSSVAWGDYDNDGRKDLLLTGKTYTGQPVSKLYHSTAAGFWDVSYLLPNLPGVSGSSVAWADYNNDGLLDFILTGDSPSGPVTKLYRNRGQLYRSSGFEETSRLIPNLPQVSDGAAAFGDYDNDGRVDLMLTGDTGHEVVSRLYHNTGSGFEPSSLLLSLPGLRSSSVAWADYDNDSSLDLLLMGSQGDAKPVSTLYQNVSTDISRQFPELPQLFNSATAWGDDYDYGINRLDVMMIGQGADFKPTSKLYQRVAGGFTDASDRLPNLPPLFDGTVNWIDYDSDNRLDLMLTGAQANKLYHNNGNGFDDQSSRLSALPGLLRSTAAWADYDNDGRVDLLINGFPRSGSRFTWLYRNTGSGFEDQTSLLPNLPSITEATATWADVNRDGRPDLILTGEYQNRGAIRLYINQEGSFAEQPSWQSGLSGVSQSTVAFGDYDSDGWLDLFISGITSSSRRISKLYHNTGTGFEDVSTQLPDLPNLAYGSAAWGDWDNDGRLDLLITGQDERILPASRFYHNTGTGFEQVPLAGIPAVYEGTLALGDNDRDGRLDLLLTGNQGQTGTQSVSRLYQNLSPLANTPPTPPGSLTSQLQAGSTRVVLNWQAGDDAQTPPAGLSYNLYVRETPREQKYPEQNVVSPLANLPETGRRWVVQLGNSQGTSYTLTGLEPGKTYYWGVQAIDGAFAGSPFSAEQRFTTSLLSDVAQPLQLVAPLYNCQTGAFTFQTTGGDGSLIEYMAPGITSWTTNPRQYVDTELRQAADAQPITLVARQSGKEVRYVFDIRAICPVGDPNQFRLVAPLYDCQSGTITFQTKGGDGSAIEYMAPGITSWTTNPNHLLDAGLRTSADVKPLELRARQGNHEVRYVWDIRAICPIPSLAEGHCPCVGCCIGSARQGVASEPGTALRAQLYPNPVDAEATLRIEGAQDQSVDLRLIDLSGQTVLERTLEVHQANHPELLDLRALRSGLYLLRVRTGQQSLTLKVVKP